MLQRLETLLLASPKITVFHVVDHDAIDAENFLLKLRCELASGQTLQIRLRAVAGYVRYSYQEFTDRPLRRWDNAPHFLHLPTFPLQSVSQWLFFHLTPRFLAIRWM